MKKLRAPIEMPVKFVNENRLFLDLTETGSSGLARKKIISRMSWLITAND